MRANGRAQKVARRVSEGMLDPIVHYIYGECVERFSTMSLVRAETSAQAFPRLRVGLPLTAHRLYHRCDVGLGRDRQRFRRLLHLVHFACVSEAAL